MFYSLLSFFLYNDPATTEIYTLSLHDALPISVCGSIGCNVVIDLVDEPSSTVAEGLGSRSEEHTSELQSLRHLVCRLLLEKKKNVLPTATPPNPSVTTTQHATRPHNTKTTPTK